MKADSTLSHIPVILLVGAFDPLDEQEAQRVGADGVLKKPFVPPDPLISMVKSALARAGALLGTPAVAPPPMPVAAKPEPVSLPKAPPILAPVIATLPEEDFAVSTDAPTRPAPFSIDKGSAPLAFGSLLDSAVPDDEAVFALSPSAAVVPDRDWGSAAEAEEAEEAEELALTPPAAFEEIKELEEVAEVGDLRSLAESLGVEIVEEEKKPS